MRGNVTGKISIICYVRQMDCQLHAPAFLRDINKVTKELRVAESYLTFKPVVTIYTTRFNIKKLSTVSVHTVYIWVFSYESQNRTHYDTRVDSASNRNKYQGYLLGWGKAADA